MHDVVIGRGAVLDHAILDKDVRVGDGALLGHGDSITANRACPDHLSSGLLVVGKGARLPKDIRVGRNARIGAFVTEGDFGGDVPAGGVVDGPQSMH
jgi:glucose-1-phosphate adenylyltransferase